MPAKITDIRFCDLCNSTKSLDSGFQHWYKTIYGRICKRCYDRRIREKGKNRLQFKEKRFCIKVSRIGVCNWCRAVVPFDAKITHFHHESYHDDSIRKDIIEICAKCHYKTRSIDSFGRLIK